MCDFKETAFRIGHLGMITPREALLVIAVLELILFELKVIKKTGSGLEAFHDCLSDEKPHDDSLCARRHNS